MTVLLTDDAQHRNRARNRVQSAAMDIKDLLGPEAVVELKEADKWRVLKELARQSAALLDLHPEPVVRALLRREELGSTGLGGGIALPHAPLTALQRPFGLFAHLKPAVPFDAIDERPVDLVFLLLLPEQQPEGHLKSMASVARRLRDPVLAEKLRTARGAVALYGLLTGA